jgi:ParB family transcriptional regulator, chromosome partitioning protein
MVDHSRLGRGLASLIGDVGDESTIATDSTRKARSRAPIENLKPNPRNPRRDFTEAELNELTTSIKQRGIIQPIVVRQLFSEKEEYEIIAGERRWRAAQRAGLHDVPIAIVEATDGQSLEFAIIENVQRTDLNPIEEAEGYDALMGQCDYSQEEVAQIVGKSRPYISNMIRLLKLAPQVQTLVRKGLISAGHARLLVNQPNQMDIAQDIIEKGMSVRELEQEMRESGERQAREIRREFRGPILPSGKDANTRALERRVSDILGLEVNIDHRGAGGVLHIKYRDLDQLDVVLRKLGG